MFGVSKNIAEPRTKQGDYAVIITYSFHSKKYCFNPIQDKILSEKKRLVLHKVHLILVFLQYLQKQIFDPL